MSNKIVCVDDTLLERKTLTLGAIYDVLEIHSNNDIVPNTVMIVDDIGEKRTYFGFRFKPVTHFRREKIERLNGR